MQTNTRVDDSASYHILEIVERPPPAVRCNLDVRDRVYFPLRGARAADLARMFLIPHEPACYAYLSMLFCKPFEVVQTPFRMNRLEAGRNLDYCAQRFILCGCVANPNMIVAQ